MKRNRQSFLNQALSGCQYAVEVQGVFEGLPCSVEKERKEMEAEIQSEYDERNSDEE